MTTQAQPAPRKSLSPRKRQRISRGIQYALLIVAIVVVLSLADWPSIQQAFLNAEVAATMWPALITVALTNTVIYAVSAYVLGFAFGLILALMRLSSVAPYRWISGVYIEIFRGLPVLVILLMISALPLAFSGMQIPGGVYGATAIGLGLVTAAYLAETFRGGIQAVPKGQMEAARSLGMPYMRAMVTIIIPQALRIVVPPLTNQFVSLLKDTSLVLFLGVTGAQVELAKFGNDVASTNANPTPLIVTGATYLVLTIPLGYLSRKLEGKR